MFVLTALSCYPELLPSVHRFRRVWWTSCGWCKTLRCGLGRVVVGLGLFCFYWVVIVWLWTLGSAFRDLSKWWNVLEVLVPWVPVCVCGDDILGLSTCKLVLVFGMVLPLRAVVRLMSNGKKWSRGSQPARDSLLSKWEGYLNSKSIFVT